MNDPQSRSIGKQFGETCTDGKFRSGNHVGVIMQIIDFPCEEHLSKHLKAVVYPAAKMLRNIIILQ